MKKLLWMKLFLFCGLGLPIQSQELEFPTRMPWNAKIGLIENVSLRLIDNVDDNCWTNPKLIRSDAFLKLEQNDIFVPDYEIAFLNYKTAEALIHAYGFRTETGICAVAAEFVVAYPASQDVGGWRGKEVFDFRHLAIVFSNSIILVNSKNVNQQLHDFFESNVSEFIATGISERRGADFTRFLELYPDNNERPMSKDDWEKRLQSMDLASED